jgi:hypothetical protein
MSALLAREADGFSSLFGVRRGQAGALLDAHVPSQAARDRAQMALRQGAGVALATLREHRGSLEAPLIAQMLDDLVDGLCSDAAQARRGALIDFFCTTVRDGRADRILRVQLDVVARPQRTPMRLHLWPAGGPDASAYKDDVLTACGLEEAEVGGFQHAPVGSWTGELPYPRATYDRCPGCAAWAAEHPAEIPEASDLLSEALSPGCVAHLAAEHRRLLRESVARRVQGRGEVSGSWAQQEATKALSRAMVEAATAYALSDGPGDRRLREIMDCANLGSIFIERLLKEARHKGRMVDFLPPEAWRYLLSHRRPQGRPQQRGGWSRPVSATGPASPSLTGEWASRRIRMGEAVVRAYRQHAGEIAIRRKGMLKSPSSARRAS